MAATYMIKSGGQLTVTLPNNAWVSSMRVSATRAIEAVRGELEREVSAGSFFISVNDAFSKVGLMNMQAFAVEATFEIVGDVLLVFLREEIVSALQVDRFEGLPEGVRSSMRDIHRIAAWMAGQQLHSDHVGMELGTKDAVQAPLSQLTPDHVQAARRVLKAMTKEAGDVKDGL